MSWPVVSAAEMRALEASAFAASVSEAQLQSNAAAQVALVAARLAPPTSRVVALVGPGNNGRDAFLAGRLLAEWGRAVFAYLGPRHAIQEDELAALGGPAERAHFHASDADLAVLAAELRRAAVALDGLLGIGVRGAPRPPLDRIIETLNQAADAGGPRVVAVDIPSGIDADRGTVAGPAVRADVTVALGAVKGGTLRFPAAALCGRLEPRPIGLPPGAEAGCRVRLLDRAGMADLVPPRPLQAHKGTLGWVLVVGGSEQYVGAPILSAGGAARSGCGLVALAVPPRVQATAATALPEATYLPREDRRAAEQQVEQIVARLGDFRALVLGPGLGRGEEAIGLVRGLLAGLHGVQSPLTAVVDADALYALALWPEWWRQVRPGCVLTPHHGEMARLTGRTIAEIGAAAWEIARESATAWQQYVVLKGAHTVVAAPDGRAWVHPYANPGLATAGSGDVLAGLIAGLAAQGADALDAARLGVVAHGLAGEQALRGGRRRSLLASDLLPELPFVLRQLAEPQTSVAFSP